MLSTANPTFAQRLVDKEIDNISNFIGSGPAALWSTDAKTLWMSDYGKDKIFAYDLVNSVRLTSLSFDTTNANNFPQGIWVDANSSTLWVAQGLEQGSNRLYGYNLANPSVSPIQRSLFAGQLTRGIWSDGNTIWTASDGSSYSVESRISASALSTGIADANKNIELASTNTGPTDIWSDGKTLWVVDGDQRKIFVYNLTTGIHDEVKSFTVVNQGPSGLWSDGSTMWVSDIFEKKNLCL